MTAAEKIEAAGLEDVIIFESPSYDDALIGVTEDNRAVYEYSKMVLWLMAADGLSPEEAADWIEFNTIGALPCAGPLGPVIMYRL